ncbi:CubicO group peptidase, beta-lactamase class C family [Polaromonas sp. YR568]|uniref:serine hydrolase domain-containing protein n=1 Tax=Polaromonas sp. YR568 TaxID=1855301 RepID=UPI0008E08F63|nr:serine hydrolase domain-containing protein [Polaromonas sp. YR568]SFU78652.1 CubicO group peptidase, beta-lactamase class C family [Polaromonas sp. YR568]
MRVDDHAKGFPRRVIAGLVAAAACCLAPVAGAQPAFERSPDISPALAAQIDALVAEYVPAMLPGLQLAIGKGGTVLYARGYGAADIRAGVPMSAATPVKIGSVTKQLTAAALLKLQEQNKISLADPLSRWIPEVRYQPDPTIGQVMQMVAGIPGAVHDADDVLLDSVPALLQEPPISKEKLFANLTARGLFAPPGSAYDYSNAGYILLGRVIERVSGLPLEQAFTQLLFRPAGMSASYLLGPVARPEAARGYYRVKPGDAWLMCPDLNSGFDATGGVVSTASDMVRWNGALRGGAVLSAPSLALMRTPARLTDGKFAPIGMGLASLGGPGSYGAAGQTVSFAAANAGYGSGYDVILLANGSNTVGDAAYPRFVLAARIHNVLNPSAPEPVPALPPNGGVIEPAVPTELLRLCQ